jgi:hypothetical protein
MQVSVVRWPLAVFALAMACGCGKVHDPDVMDAAAGEVDSTLADAPASDSPPPADAGTADARPGPTQLSLAAGTPTTVLGTGGVQAEDVCPAGLALIGYSGATGAYGGSSVPVVGEITGRCAVLGIGVLGATGYAVTAQPSVVLPVRGVNTATKWSLTCTDNKVVVGLDAHWGSALDSFAVRCASLTVVAQGTGWAVQIGTPAALPAQGGTGGANMGTTSCSGGIATGSDPKVVAQTAPLLAVLGAIGVACSTITAQ